LDQFFEAIYKKEVEKFNMHGEEDPKDAPQISMGNSTWCIPSHMTVFLEPVIETLEGR
jgi:hypothetical protein